uniref:PH domain-containing protein n=1 Tax=Schistosoma haematobium TaxID=6185 RepID=A0A094ZYY0_SCHHA
MIGRVDLEHCECIIENVNIGQPCAFSISTLFNGNKRIYYFIAANNKIMSDWVRHLAHVAELVDVSTTNVTSNQRTVVENIDSNRSAGGVCNELPLFQRPSKIPPDNNANVNNNDNGVHSRNSNGGDIGTKSPNNQHQSLSNNHVNRDNDNGEDDYKEVIGGLPDSRHSYVNLTNAVVTEKEFNINYSSLPRIDQMKQTTSDITCKLSNEIYLKRNNQITQNTRIYRKSHCAPGSSSTLSNSPLLHPSFDQKSNRQCLLIKTGAGTKTNRKPAPPPRMSPLKSSSFTLPSTFTNSINVLSGLNLESPLPVRAKGSDMSVDSSLNSSSTCSDVNISILNDTTHENVDDGRGKNEFNNNNGDNLDRNHNMIDKEINEDNKENRIQSVDHHCNINVIDKNQPNSNINLTKAGISVNKISHLNYIEPYNLDLRTVQCPKEHNNGVDAGGNLLSSRVTTLTTSVLKTGSAFPILATTTTTVNSDISSNVTGSSNTAITSVCSNLFNKQLSTNGLQQTVIMSLTHPHSFSSSCSTTTTTFTNINPLLSSQSDSSVFLKSNKTLMSCNGISNMTTATASNSANQPDDEHIEYREIDPISTNALAIVKERFG